MNTEISKKRKPLIVKPTKYEAQEAILVNKKYWRRIFNDMDNPVMSAEKESELLLKVLPQDLYEKVCLTLNMPVKTTRQQETVQETEQSPRRIKKQPLLSYKKTLYIDRELDSDTDVEFSSSEEEEFKPNIHQELLRKPIREAITWQSHFLEPEKEEEKGLVKKADDLTHRIATEFCEYMTQLGGKQQSQLFTPSAIKELFQIEFDTHVARSLRVVPKELPTVGERVAIATGHPEKSLLNTLDSEITKDIIVDKRLDKMKAFNLSLPHKDQWRATRNKTKEKWRSAKNVPRDLVTLKTVWEGITGLRSVREYCRWMLDHPEYRRAPYLNSLGMFDTAVLNARSIYNLQNEPPPTTITYTTSALSPMEQLKKRLSVLVENESTTEQVDPTTEQVDPTTEQGDPEA